MGTIIEATATASGHRRPFAPGALKLADDAARLCLERADRGPNELDLLINAGVYHDKLMNEPALASLIQEDIEANPDLLPGADHGTFSFDVSNGACGLLTGIHLVDGLLASGTVNLGMVVASDIDPEPGVSEGFAFPAVGGAVLLSADDDRAGFEAFQFATFPEFADLFQSYVDWHEDARRGLAHHGRNILTVEITESYAARALECAELTARELATHRRSISARSISSWRRHRSLGSPTAWRSASVCPSSGSHRLRTAASSAHTRPRPRSRSSPERSGPRVPFCSSPPARESRWPPRSTELDRDVSRQRIEGAEIARLQLLLPPVPGAVARVAPAAPSELRPLARIVAEIAGRLTAGGPPSIFTTLGQHPRLFRAWLRYSAQLMPFGRLPRRDTELVILRVAWRSRSAYEWNQHVAIALRVGVSPDDVAGVADGPSAVGFTERQRALLAVSDELLAERALSDATWSAVQVSFTKREVIELCLLVGHYQGLASAIGGLGIQIEQPAGPAVEQPPAGART